jgi:hypothetical protein
MIIFVDSFEVSAESKGIMNARSVRMASVYIHLLPTPCLALAAYRKDVV